MWSRYSSAEPGYWACEVGGMGNREWGIGVGQLTEGQKGSRRKPIVNVDGCRK